MRGRYLFSGRFNPMANGNRNYPSGPSAVWESAVGLVVVADSESGSDRFLGVAACLIRLTCRQVECRTRKWEDQAMTLGTMMPGV